MLNTTYLPDLKAYYVQFIHSPKRPQLKRLTHWGKQRFFLAQYFDVVEESYERQQIVLRYQQHYVELNLNQAPDFMNQSAYLDWLKQQLAL